MLSKKMAFSLMGLITILVLALITVPAMAADDFDATFSVDSISTSSDHNAEYAAADCRYAYIRIKGRWYFDCGY